MPIFTASTSISDRTESICRRTKAGGTLWTPLHAQCVLCRQRRDDRGAIDAKRREGL